VPLRQERDALAERVAREETELSTLRADLAAVTANLSEERAGLIAANTEVRRLTERLEQTEVATSNARHESDLAREQLEVWKNELASVRAEQAQLDIEHQNAMRALEELTSAVAERDRAIATREDQFKAKLEYHRELSHSAERKQHEEIGLLRDEFASLSVQHD